MPILGCGAELAQVLKVSDDDIGAIEEKLDELLEAGVDRAQAQRMAVADVLAEVEMERDEILAAIREQHPPPKPKPESKGEEIGSERPKSASERPESATKPEETASPPRQSISAADLKGAVEQLAAAGMKKLQVADTVKGLPESGKKRIQSEGLDGVRGMYDQATDTVWLVRENLKDQDEALFVGLHEAFHRGLRATLGPEVDAVLDQIYLTNPSVRRGAEERMESMKMSRREATEETLADMAGDGVAGDLRGWDRLVALIRNFIGKLGMTLKFTDQMVMDLVAGARRAGLTEGTHLESAAVSSAQPAPFSRKLADEVERKDVQIEQKTIAQGFDADGQRTWSKWLADTIPGLELDKIGDVQLRAGNRAYEALAALTGPAWTRLGMKAASPELRRQLRQMKIAVQKAQETAAAVAGESMKLSDAERAMVSDLIEQEIDAGTVPPEHAVRLANLISNTMSTQTDELVRLGMLTKDTADRWRGKYLPRFYKSKLQDQVADAWADALKRITGRQSTMKGIKGKHLKGRGLFDTVPADALADYQALGWEVRDPDFEAHLQDPKGVEQPPEVQVWRDFTREEREKMGEIRDAGFRFVMGYMQTQRDIALGKMFEGMANDTAISSRLPKEDWVQVPDSKVPSTGAMRYGKMAGRWVSPETLSHLTAIEESQSEAWTMYRKAMGIWKEGKTVLNPVSHANNIVSNLTMAHLAGVGYHRADKYLGAMRDFATKASEILEAKDAGLFLGTLSDTELFNSLPPELAALATKQASAGEKIGGSVFNLLSFYLRKPMGWAYQAEDTFFRYLLYKEARRTGLEPQDAVDYAQRYIFTYDDLPKGARNVRDFALPFFSYTYKAVPALLHTALTHPHRMAAPGAVLWGVNAAAYAIAAGDDDDSWWETLQRYLSDPEFRKEARDKEDLEREHLPAWMKGTTALQTPKTIRLGMDEVTKLPLFIDISRMIPGGDLFDVSPNSGGLPIPQPITPSHPLFTTAVAMIGNKDLFYGKELVDSNDTKGEATEKRLSWLWHQVAPAIALGNYHWERGLNALAQASGGEIEWLPEFISERYTGIGRDSLPVQPGKAALQTIGIKVRPLDLDKSEAITESQRKKLVRDIDTEINRMKRLNQLGAVSDRAFDRAADEASVKKDRLNEGLTIDGEKPN
jgi:hypothetical protein